MQNHQIYKANDLILRDALALDRTVLANERPLLSYIRSAFALEVAGLSFIESFSSRLVTTIGLLFIPAGLVFLIVGVVRIRRLQVQLAQLQRL